MNDSLKTMNNVNSRDKENLIVLNHQSEKILDSKKKLEETNGLITRTNRMVMGLLRNISMNKILLIVIIFLLALLNLIVVYIKIKRAIFG